LVETGRARVPAMSSLPVRRRMRRAMSDVEIQRVVGVSTVPPQLSPDRRMHGTRQRCWSRPMPSLLVRQAGRRPDNRTRMLASGYSPMRTWLLQAKSRVCDQSCQHPGNNNINSFSAHAGRLAIPNFDFSFLFFYPSGSLLSKANIII